MPVFEYSCNQCKKEFEILVFTGEDKNISCPGCKSNDVKKKMTAESFMGDSIGKAASTRPKDPS